MKKIILFFTLFIIFPAIITFAQDIQQGNATWYEDDSAELHASHARFPPGTRLRVTNLNNQKEVYVTVTDRIQNSDNRILDVSQEAASLLGMNKRGYTPIRLVVIRGLTAEPTPPASTAGNSSYDDFYPDDEPVPEITVVSPDYDDYEDYESYEDNEYYYEEDPPPATASIETPPSPPPPPPPPIRTFPRQPAPQSQPEPAVQPQAEAQVLLKKLVVIINGKEQTLNIPDGVYIPLPVTGPTSSTPAYTPPPPPSRPMPAYSPYPSYTPPPPPPRPMPVSPPPVQVASPIIKIIPKLPDPQSGKVYRVQVGAFSRVALAQVCFDRLKAAGFAPAFEQNGGLYRVVISGIRAADVSYAAQRLSAAGFTEAWIREENRP
jgi:cell division septation protein DedD